MKDYSNEELADRLEMGATALRLARPENLRKVADQIADVGIEAAGRLRALEGPLAGRARNVVVHADGRLTCELEIADAGAGRRFLEQIGRAGNGGR